MNVWHFYARYYNFGDYALGVGMRNIIMRYCKGEFIFKLFDTHHYSFDRTIIRKMNQTADFLLVGGGGLIHELGANGKWLFDMPDNLIPRVTIPAIFYGLGYNAFPGQPDITQKVINNLLLWQAKAISFSVRADGSKERLARIGIQATEVPDPGFFIDSDYPRPSIEGEYIVIQLANDMKKYRAFENDVLLRNIRQVVGFLLNKGYKILLAPHVRADIILSDELIDSMEHPAGLMKWDLFDLLRDENTNKGLAFYKHARFVIAMRGHAQICPIGMGTPVITIASHEKNRGLLEHLKVTPLCAEVKDTHLGDRLIEYIREVENNREQINTEYRAAMALMEETVEKHFSSLESTIAQSQTKLRCARAKKENRFLARGKRLARKALSVLHIG